MIENNYGFYVFDKILDLYLHFANHLLGTFAPNVHDCIKSASFVKKNGKTAPEDILIVKRRKIESTFSLILQNKHFNLFCISFYSRKQFS